MKKRIFSLLAAVCLFLLPLLPVSAERQFEDCIKNCKLYDPDGVFNAEQQAELDNIIRQASDEANLYVAVYILNGSGSEMSTGTCMTFADDRYDELFNPQQDVDTDGVLLVLNLDMPASESGRYLYISTSGMGQLIYYEDESDPFCRCEKMMDHIVSYMPRGQEGDLYGAVNAFCEDVKTYAKQGAPKNAYTKDYSKGLYYYEKNGKLVSSKTLPLSYRLNYGIGLIVGSIAAALTALISFAVIKSRYKFTKSLSASNYISDKETTFYQRDDMFIRTHTTKTRIDTDRSGGGGSFGGGGSSHSSSGGHSHSGGGRSF